MFKKENQIWLYLIGILIFFGVLIAISANYLVPVVKSGNIGLLFQSQKFAKAPDFTINENLDYFAEVVTNQGTFTIQLYDRSAPKNVNNFVYLCQNDYYTDTKFQRLVPGLLFQGGDRNTLDSDPNNDGKGRTGYLIDDETNWDALDLTKDQKDRLTGLGYKSEAGLETPHFEKYSVAMANGGPNTNSSQFFIITADSQDSRLASFDGQYTIIGKVISGTDVIDKINKISVTNPDSVSPTPKDPIIFNSVTVYTR